MIPFAVARPWLFHVTRRSALPGIRRLGLRPAAAFLPPSADIANRGAWTQVGQGEGATAWLRWQRLPDVPLTRRLPPTITPSQWRGFINGMVFVFETLSDAHGLIAARDDVGVDQVVIQFSTEHILAAGCDLRLCRWNNGFLDRSKPPRLRSFDDYTPAAAWRKGHRAREVTVAGGIPASVPFAVVPPA